MPGLDHTIVWSADPAKSAAYLAGILGLAPPTRFDRFHVVTTSNGVSLDFAAHESGDPVAPQHYAFLVSEAEFDAGMARIEAAGQTFWADPGRQRSGQINHLWGGRGVYFEDPDGHLLEMLTRPYGSEEDM